MMCGAGAGQLLSHLASREFTVVVMKMRHVEQFRRDLPDVTGRRGMSGRSGSAGRLHSA